MKVNYAENLVSLQKNSVRITLCEEDDVAGEQGRGEESLYAVSFNYDALVPSVVRIFVTASDRTVPHQIRYVSIVFHHRVAPVMMMYIITYTDITRKFGALRKGQCLH